MMKSRRHRIFFKKESTPSRRIRTYVRGLGEGNCRSRRLLAVHLWYLDSIVFVLPHIWDVLNYATMITDDAFHTRVLSEAP